MAIITLTTDFGTDDPYVGFMKGVILAIAPGTTIVDLTHAIPPQDIRQAAWVLGTSIAYFPAGTIHLAVVDPGVGSTRRALALEVDGALLVGPDNGIFSAILGRFRGQSRGWAGPHPDPLPREEGTASSRGRMRAVALTNPAFHRRPISPTFHGRDIFAPAAAHLARGVPLEELGPIVDDPAIIDLPQPREVGAELEIHVVRIDHFGNLITDLSAEQWGTWAGAGEAPEAASAARARSDAQALADKPPVAPTAPEVWSGAVPICGVALTFSDVAPGHAVAYLGSSGYMEIAVRNNHAARKLHLGIGAPLRLRRT
jgi:hypothetical protein